MREAAITNMLSNDDLEEVIALFLQSESEIITMIENSFAQFTQYGRNHQQEEAYFLSPKEVAQQ